MDEDREDSYLRQAKESGKLVIGVLVHENQMRRNNMETADALYREIERQGAFPVVLVTNILPPGTKEGMGLEEALAHYISPCADALINTTGMSVKCAGLPG